MSDTPRTDAADNAEYESLQDRNGWVTHGYTSNGWNFARELEKELTARTQEVERLRKRVKKLEIDLEAALRR